MNEQERKARGEDYPQLKLDNQLCFPLYAAARRVVNAYTPLLKPLGLTYTQYIVMLALWESEKTTVGDLCRRLYLDCGTVTPLLKKLEENEWIIRRRSREDERVVEISVTDKGWDLREEVREIPGSMASCVSMEPEDGRALYTLLYRLLDAMD